MKAIEPRATRSGKTMVQQRLPPIAHLHRAVRIVAVRRADRRRRRRMLVVRVETEQHHLLLGARRSRVQRRRRGCGGRMRVGRMRMAEPCGCASVRLRQATVGAAEPGCGAAGLGGSDGGGGGLLLLLLQQTVDLEPVGATAVARTGLGHADDEAFLEAARFARGAVLLVDDAVAVVLAVADRRQVVVRAAEEGLRAER